MGLFDIFKPKTVEARYKTLLGLFRCTHRTFTITRNEKCVVEFTLQGMEKGSLQYGRIEQNFDYEKIETWSYIVDPSSIVIVKMQTTLGGKTICVQKEFDQHYNQTMMYNEVMSIYLNKVIQLGASLEEK